jgi:hypothetical protein
MTDAIVAEQALDEAVIPGGNGEVEAPVEGEAVYAEEQRQLVSGYLFLVQSGDVQINRACITSLLRALDELGLGPERKADRLTLVLQSDGGDPDAAFQFVRVARAYCEKLDVVIPRWAKSAATLMSLGADTVYMGVASELGPLDMQLEAPQQERYSSALDGTQCLTDLQQAAAAMAYNLARSYGGRFLRITKLRRKDIFDGLVAFACQTIEPVMRQIDPWVLHECYRLLDTSRRYARRLLEDYMLVADADKEKTAAWIAEELVAGYPIHSYVILRDEAKHHLKLRVENGETRPDWAVLST